MTDTVESRQPASAVVILQTGGTIDKAYPAPTGGYAFEITEPAAGRILERANVRYTDNELPNLNQVSYSIHEVLRKDSQDITDTDRLLVYKECLRSYRLGYRCIVITHGTDTMIETANFLLRQEEMLGVSSAPRLVVVLTGSKLPERFKDSDADFNLGLAVGAALALPRGVYIAMNGQIIAAGEAIRSADGKFSRKVT